jgi:hypothetical protein
VKRGGAVHIFSIFYTHHRVPNEHMVTINVDTITNNYMKLFMWSKLMKYYFKKIDKSFHQRSLISVFQIWFNVYLLTSYMTRFGLWIFMSKNTHDFWLCDNSLSADLNVGHIKLTTYISATLRRMQDKYRICYFILQSVHLLYKYAIRIHFCFIRTTNKLSLYPIAMYSGGRRQVWNWY